VSNEEKREEIFDRARKKFGFVPNVIKELALSPVVAEAYMTGVAAQRRAVSTARPLTLRWERWQAWRRAR